MLITLVHILINHYPGAHHTLPPASVFAASLSLQQLWLYSFRLRPHWTSIIYLKGREKEKETAAETKRVPLSTSSLPNCPPTAGTKPG